MRQSFNIRLPAGKVWPQYESEQTGGGRQIKRYNWIRIHNRGTVDLWVDTKGIPNANLNDLSEVWDIIPAGQLVVRNLGAAEDPDGWADELHVASPGGTGQALIEISDRPIVDIRTNPKAPPLDPYTADTQFFAGRADFSNLFDDFGPASNIAGVNLAMASQFDPALIKQFGTNPTWQPTFGGGAEFQTLNTVQGLAYYTARAVLPLQAGISVGGSVVFGIKQSGSSSPGAMFRFRLTPTQLLAEYKPTGDIDGNSTTIDITASLPASYATVLHQYSIITGEDAVRFAIDGVVVLTLSVAAMQIHPAGTWRGSWAHNGANPLTPAIYYLTLTAAQPGRSIAVNFPSVSGANAAQAVVLDLKDCQAALDIVSVASGGTATLQIEVSTDNANWTSIDTLAAAATQAKHYGVATVGATVAVCPLAFRFVRITAGAAGVGFTTTLTVSAK